MALQRCPSPNPQNGYVPWERGVRAVDGIKVTDLKMGDDPRLSRWAQGILKGL